MILAWLLAVSAAEVVSVDQPPIEIGTVGVTQPAPLTINYDPSASDSFNKAVTTLFFSGFWSVSDCTAFLNKMALTESVSTLHHRFALGFASASQPDHRAAKRLTTAVRGVAKGDGTYDVTIKRAAAETVVVSKIVETTCQKWWIFEWGQKQEISWRPLKAAELDQIYNEIENVASSVVDEISSW